MPYAQSYLIFLRKVITVVKGYYMKVNKLLDKKTSAFLALAIGVAFITQAKKPAYAQQVGFNVCNNASRYPLSVAIVTSPTGSSNSFGGTNTIIESRGWWPISPGQCRLLYFGNAYDVRAVAAQDGTGKFWPERGGDIYCMSPRDFYFRGKANESNSECQKQGGAKGGSIRVGTTARFYTFTFLP